MILVRAGHRYLNLEYLVQAEDESKEPEPKELPPGSIRVTMENGRPFDVHGEDAEGLRAVLDCLMLQPFPVRPAKRTGASRVIRRSPESGVAGGSTHSPPQDE